MNPRTSVVIGLLCWAIGVACPAAHAQLKLRDTLAAHTELVTVAEFSPDGKWLATGARDSTTRLWDLATGKSRVIGGKAIPGELSFSPDSQTLILTSGFIHEMQVCDVATGKSTTLRKRGSLATLAFSPDGKSHLFADGLEAKLEELATPFDVKSGGKALTLTGAAPVNYGKNAGYMFSPDGKTVAIKDKERNVMLWDVAAGTAKTMPQSAGMWMTFDTKGAQFAAEFGVKSKSLTGLKLVDNPSVKIVNLAASKAVTLALNPNDPQFGHPVVFSPDGKSVLTASAGGMTLWSTATGKPAATFAKPANATIQAGLRPVFSPDGKTLAAHGNPPQITLWNVASRKVIAAFKVESPLLAFSPDSKTLAVCGERTKILLYDVPGK